MTLHDRLRLLRGPMSYRDFASRIGWPLNTIRRYELGLARVPVDYVDAVCRSFEVTADWLLFGIEADAGARVVAEGERRRDYVLIAGERVRLVRVPVLARIPAGPPLEVNDPMPVGFGLEGEVLVPDPDDPHAYGLVAWGDSMEPVIGDGETIVASPRRAYGFRRGYAIIRIPGNETCVKSVIVQQRRIIVESVNPAYPRMEFSPAEAQVIAAVVGWLTRGEFLSCA